MNAEQIQNILNDIEGYISSDETSARFLHQELWPCYAEYDYSDECYIAHDGVESARFDSLTDAVDWMIQSIDLALSTELENALEREKPEPLAVGGYTIISNGSGDLWVEVGDARNQDDGQGISEFYYIESIDDLADIERDLGEQRLAKARAQIMLLETMTAVEIAAKFDTTERNVRMAAERHAVTARQSGSTWLISRTDAERMWKRRS